MPNHVLPQAAYAIVMDSSLPLAQRQQAFAERGSSILERICGDGWMAIGDAAASFDPLASRGLVRALESGIELGDLIGASPARLAEHDHAVRVEFERYELERRSYSS